MTIRLGLRDLLLATSLLAAPALAHEGEHEAAAQRTEFLSLGQGASGLAVPVGTPVLIPGLGSYGMAIETVEPLARAWFDQGLGHL